ncbi:hypothetical protein [Parendozoicomonas haliclonae]
MIKRFALVVGLGMAASGANAGLFLYSFSFMNSITVHLFNNGQPVSGGTVDVFNANGRKVDTLQVENGEAQFRFPFLGPYVRLVAHADGLSAQYFQNRESYVDH